MQKNKIMRISNIIYIIVMLSVLTFSYSCAKKEPAAQPDPNEIMKKISVKFPESKELQEENITFQSGKKSKELSEKAATNIYSDDKNKPVDLSKIEKYSVIKADDNSAEEIGIFKLYDKTNAEYVKKMAQARISKMRDSENQSKNADISETINNAEIRSYGNYVYYVSHPQKDKIFEIIEDTLRGA